MDSIGRDNALGCHPHLLRMIERMRDRTSLFLAAILVCGAPAAAEAASFFVDPAHYALYNCEQLNTARKAVAQRVAELQGLMAKAETGFAGSLMSGLAYQSEFVTARGQLEQIDENRQKLNCGPVPIEKPATPTHPDRRKSHPKR